MNGHPCREIGKGVFFGGGIRATRPSPCQCDVKEQLAQGYANNNTIAAQEISRLTLDGWSGSSNNGKTALDLSSLAIYEGAMSATKVKALYNASIPEPATATLSLLALAGLAARRRK